VFSDSHLLSTGLVGLWCNATVVRQRLVAANHQALRGTTSLIGRYGAR
jgi:hypothetical protein